MALPRITPRIGGAPGLFGLDCQVFFDRPGLERHIDKRKLRFLGQWGAYVRRAAINSIKRKGAARKAPKKKYVRPGSRTWTKAYRRWYQEARKQKPSPPGTPPFTHTGLLRKAILFALDKPREDVIVGPSANIISDIGAIHEKGGTREGKRYPPRPFMVPARDRSQEKVPELARRAFG